MNTNNMSEENYTTMENLVIELHDSMMELCNKILKQDPKNDELITKVKNYKQKYQEFINFKD